MPSRRIHKNWVHDFVAKTHDKTEAPERYLYWGAVSAVGGALRRRCYLNMGQFKWYCNFYIVLVGPPGLVKKSTTVDMALSILRKVPGINFGSDCTTWEQFVAEVEAAKDTFAVGGREASLYDQEYEVTSALTLSISEFGTFFDPRNHILVNVLTEFWDAKDTTWRKSTKTQGDNVIVAPFVNLIAGTTPDWMNDNFKKQFGGWGLSSRCIFLYSDRVERPVPYPDELWGAEIDTWQETFVHDLEQISRMEGAFALSPEARALGHKWYSDHLDRVSAFAQHPHSDPWTGYYLARKQTHIHKLALVLAASQREDYIIHLSDLQEAIVRCDEIEDEISNIFGSRRRRTHEGELNEDVARGVVNGILGCPNQRVLEGDVYRFTFKFMAYGKAKDLIANMLRADFLERVQAGTQVYLAVGPQGSSLLPQEKSFNGTT